MPTPEYPIQSSTKKNKLCMKLCYVSVTLEYLLKMERKMLFYTVHQTISEVCVFSFIYPKAKLKSAPHIDHKIRESGPLMFEMYMFRRHLVWTSQPVQFILDVREKHQPCSCFCFLHAALNLKLKWHYFYIVLLWEDSMTRFWSIKDQHEFLKTPMQLLVCEYVGCNTDLILPSHLLRYKFAGHYHSWLIIFQLCFKRGKFLKLHVNLTH